MRIALIVLGIIIIIFAYLAIRYYNCKSTEGSACSDTSSFRTRPTFYDPINVPIPGIPGGGVIADKKVTCSFFGGKKCIPLTPSEIIQSATSGRG